MQDIKGHPVTEDCHPSASDYADRPAKSTPGYFPGWHPSGETGVQSPTPRVYLYENYMADWNPRKDDYNLQGFIEMEDMPLRGVVKTAFGYHVQSNMFFERFELEVKVAMSPNCHGQDLYEFHNRSANPESPYEFRDTQGTRPGPYPINSRIQFGTFQVLVPHEGASPIIRYDFTATIPNRIFADYGPNFHRYFEIEARAWFFADVFPKIDHTRPAFAVRMATDTFRAYMAPYTKYHICDWEGIYRAPFVAHRFSHLSPLSPDCGGLPPPYS